MKFKVKDMDISTGGAPTVILNKQDAIKYALRYQDRLLIKSKKGKVIAVLDIAESKKALKPGTIGLFEEALSKTKTKNGEIVEVEITRRPNSLEFIKKKLLGSELVKEEFHQIIDDIVNDRLDAVEMAFFVSAAFTQNLSAREVVILTKEIFLHGETLKIKKKIVLDKHCTGGVPGNRTTLLFVPIMASLGYTIPKTSSRSITSPAGTADTMEVLADVSFPAYRLKNILKKAHAFICWGGALNLAAADDKLIRVRNVLSLDPEGLLLASILAKKAAVSSTHVLLDIPIGLDTKIRSVEVAKKLEKKFKYIGKSLGMKIFSIITDGNQPIGNGIGPALECKDVLYILQNDPRAPLDLKNKSIKLCEFMLKKLGKKNPKRLIMNSLESGAAWKEMQKIIKAQGGNPNIRADDIALGEFFYEVKSAKSGKIIDINNHSISRIARLAGAPVDKGAGIYSKIREGDKVKKGQLLYVIYSHSQQKLDFAIEEEKRKTAIIIK